MTFRYHYLSVTSSTDILRLMLKTTTFKPVISWNITNCLLLQIRRWYHDAVTITDIIIGWWLSSQLKPYFDDFIIISVQLHLNPYTKSLTPCAEYLSEPSHQYLVSGIRRPASCILKPEIRISPYPCSGLPDLGRIFSFYAIMWCG